MSEVHTTDKKEDNRKRYPEIAKWVDEVRKYFPDAKVVSIKPISSKTSDVRPKGSH